MNGQYLLRRLLQVPPAVIGILVVVFLLIHLAPGDPILALAGESGDAAYYAEMRAKFGLDRPLLEQLGIFLGNLIRFDFGTSYVLGRPAVDIILERVPSTLLLTSAALIVASIGGVGLGLYAAARAHRRPDLTVNVVVLALDAMPSFWLAQAGILIFGLWAGLLPISGMTDARAPQEGAQHVIDIAVHMVLPVAVLAATEVAVIARLTRIGLLEEMSRDYIRTARAKGVAAPQVLRRHALRPAALPVVTVIGNRVGHLLAGAVLVEAVFGWPGIGRLLLTSVQSRDIPIVMGIFMLISVVVIVANIATDLLYARLDPRIRVG